MEGSEVLLAICEVSIAFAGFTSIVGVVGQRGGGRWDAEDSFRLWLMIESSLATLFFSLLPFVLFHLDVHDETMWAAASGTVALFLVVHLIIVSPRVARLERERRWSTRRFEPLIGGVIVSTLVVQSLNVLGVGFGRTFGAYLLGLILFLGLASMHFVALLVAVHHSDARGDD